jgi:hypothetical protein
LAGRREEDEIARPIDDMLLTEENAAPIPIPAPSMMVFQPTDHSDPMMIPRSEVNNVMVVVVFRSSGVYQQLFHPVFAGKSYYDLEY